MERNKRLEKKELEKGEGAMENMEYYSETECNCKQNRSPFPDLIVCIRLFHVLMQQMCDLPMGELVMLILISKYQTEEESITATELVKRMCLSRPAVSRMLHTLEKKELLILDSDSEDHRCVRIRISPKGKEIIQKEMETCADILKSAADRVGEEDVRIMLEVNRRFSAEIAAELEERTRGK